MRDIIRIDDCDTRRPPNDGAHDDLPPCKNCGQDFSEHHDAEDGWLCPYEYQMDSVYGSFCGGDPRNFSPDYECSTPQELENHRKACEEAEIAANPNLPCPSGWERLPDGTICHVLRCPFGLGVTTFPPTYYETINESEAGDE